MCFLREAPKRLKAKTSTAQRRSEKSSPKSFKERIIDVNDPHLLTWLEESAHGKLHGRGYNPAWKRFFDKNRNASKEQIVDKLVEMIKEHNFVVPGFFT